jgi:uncharacterized protein YoaH (UPF0181 family)
MIKNLNGGDVQQKAFEEIKEYMKVEQAWARSTSSGTTITIASGRRMPSFL